MRRKMIPLHATLHQEIQMQMRGNTNTNARKYKCKYQEIQMQMPGNTNACCDAPEWDCLLQSDMSGEYSQAKHGKDFFSAINGSIKDLIAVSALYE